MTARVRTCRTPASENGTVPPARVKNAELRPREYLTEGEVEALLQVAKKRGRYGHRDATMMLVCYTHGLRVSELCSLAMGPGGFCSRRPPRHTTQEGDTERAAHARR